MTIPLDSGFTVVTGPNGSGKSNILDGVLFCLGLANSKGMRADRLPDLVNSRLLKAGKSAETSVSVRFDLNDWEPDPAEEGLEAPEEGPWIKPGQKEWIVTRRLRVMPGGSYSSSYAADGENCNLQQLQTQLRRLRIDPEGSNVVMQGDVTRIVSMSNRERRSLIDELAGVGLFDRRIEQTRSKLEDVSDRQERCRIVEQELLASKHRLERDCSKARTYQQLKTKLQTGRQQELVLNYESVKQNLQDLETQHQQLGEKEIQDLENLSKTEKELSNSTNQLKLLQENVKELGEDQLINVQAKLAGLETQDHELEKQATRHRDEGEQLKKLREEIILRRQTLQLDVNNQQDNTLRNSIEEAEIVYNNAHSSVAISRRRLADAAGRSGAWLEQQNELRTQRNRIQEKIEPLKQEQQRLEERILLDKSRQEDLESDLNRDNEENRQFNKEINKLEAEWVRLLNDVESHRKKVNEATDSLSVQQRTRKRLEQEQTNLERDIARLDSRREALCESRGTGALKLLLEAGLDGIHGPVAQLGEVAEHLRLALEVAAGGRMGQVVVDDDKIAAKAIEVLKLRRAGRLTFLPLNRIKPSKSIHNPALAKGTTNSDGLLGKAVELIRYEDIYKDVFAYVFGETLVFKTLSSARIHLGRTRAVTLDGELLEKSGAMTGGSFSGRSNNLSFGRSIDRDEAEPLRERLLELGEALIYCKKQENQYIKYLDSANLDLRKLEQRQAALDAKRTTARKSNSPLIERQQKLCNRLNNVKGSQKDHREKLSTIAKELEPLIKECEKLEKNNKETESGDSKIWNRLQVELEASEERLLKATENREQLLKEQQKQQLMVQRLNDQKESLLSEEKRLQKSVETLSQAHQQWREQQQDISNQRETLERKNEELQARLGTERRARDAAEAELANQRQKLQQSQWELERLRQDRESITEELRNGKNRLKELKNNLPNPAPDIPEEVRNAGLEALQGELLKIQQSMEALEPVNMLALEELEQLEIRLQDLISKLEVLNEERSELLLRIETVATLRQEAFMEAFKAVDIHFREIFARLSDGDGHLQLDNSEDPLEGGLTLVAHPKGKTVRRLAAMSGGEKSLTALSFLFALQRFRPSPFYALDEVDSFLDGVNVERLSALIAQQAKEAQFLVVSHRRPMISASSRTIGVTQARGSHTQVVGLPDAA